MIISGAGTSGRLAFFCARTFNAVLKDLGKPPCFHYLIAGGDKALIVGQEGSEDDVKTGVSDLEGIISSQPSSNKIVYIGITCGFSAPYVAAQLEYFMTSKVFGSEFVSILMGFNPVGLARKVRIEKWDKSFHDVVQEMCRHKTEDESNNRKPRFFILNPVVGPEPLTGSTRMKGGSVTKILLELIFSSIFSKVFGLPLVPTDKNKLLSKHDQADILYCLITCYEKIYRDTYYSVQNQLPLFLERAGGSLRAAADSQSENKQGHVYYIAHDTLGILAFVDASETVPTFGASFEEVRGTIVNHSGNTAWGILGNREGDLSSVGSHYNISQSHFEDAIVPSLSGRDTVIVFHYASAPNENMVPLVRLCKKGTNEPCIALVTVINTTSDRTDKLRSALEEYVTLTMTINLPFTDILPNVPAFAEMSVKWVLNAISTGGFILQGKVYENRMIDLGITNSKLFDRACGIIAQFGNVDTKTARVNLLRAIYSIEQNSVPSEIDTAPVYQHIDAAHSKKVSKIIPLAILLSSGKFNLHEAKSALSKDPVVRNILAAQK